MNKMSKNATMLWTVVKESSLDLYDADLLGYEVRNLVTFVPNEADFLAHPLSFMKCQAEALQLPHYTLEVNEPFKESYENAICYLKERYGIDTLITGDIAEVNGHPNWIRECSKYSDIDVLTPLWGHNRLDLLNRFLSCKFEAIFSCVKKPWFTEEWVGMKLNRDSLEHLSKINAGAKLDICGEQGEYHTLVLNGPPFKKSILITVYNTQARDSLMYIDIQKLSLQEK